MIAVPHDSPVSTSFSVDTLTGTKALKEQMSATTSNLQQPAKSTPDYLPEAAFEVTEAKTSADLQRWLPAWKVLTTKVIEANVFYEPEFLLNALDQYGSDEVRVLLVHSRPRGKPNGEPILCGLFPVTASRDQKQIKFSSLETWRPSQVFLTTPLVRSDVAEETFEAVWNHLSSVGKPPFYLTLNCVGADGPFQQAITQFLQKTELPYCIREMHRRAVFRLDKNAEAYFARWSKVRRHSVTRLGKRLSEAGELSVDLLKVGDDPTRWIEQFLDLEAKGWKGKVGTALSQDENNHKFASSMLKDFAANGKLMMLALRVDGKPVAMKCNLFTGNQGFAWKIAYDENFHKYSPGCVLEKANIELLHQKQTITWMDSCASANHPMIDSLWHDRRIVQSISIGTKRSGAPLLIAALPLLRWTQLTASRWKAKFARCYSRNRIKAECPTDTDGNGSVKPVPT